MAAPGQTPQSDSSVAELQRVLTTYAQVTGFTPANPGPVDGIVGIKTTLAVMAMLPRVPGMPTEVSAMAPVIALLLATNDGQTQAFGLIKRNAGTISKGIIALEAYQVASTQNPPGNTPTAVSIKSGTIWNPQGSFAPAAGVVAPTVSVTSGGAVPAQPTLTIWFYDIFTHQYRVAVPRAGLGSSYVDYVEVSSAASQPNFGTEVSRLTFMSAIGKWWATPGGIALIVGGAAAVGTVAFLGVRALAR